MKVKIAFIGVNYKSSKETIQWIKSIKKNVLEENIIIIVVDNSQSETDVNLKSDIKQVDNSIVYINDMDNKGYFSGANKGMKYLNDNNIGADYYIISNVDLSFASSNICEELDRLDCSEVGVFAPKIIENERDSNPYKVKRLTKQQLKRRILYHRVSRFRIVRWLLRAYGLFNRNVINENAHSENEKIYAAYGACFIFSARFFEKGGTINYPIFLYQEELFVAEQCIKIGLNIIYCPNIKINSIGHVSTGKMNNKKKINALIEATEYMLQKYY